MIISYFQNKIASTVSVIVLLNARNLFFKNSILSQIVGQYVFCFGCLAVMGKKKKKKNLNQLKQKLTKKKKSKTEKWSDIMTMTCTQNIKIQNKNSDT